MSLTKFTKNLLRRRKKVLLFIGLFFVVLSLLLYLLSFFFGGNNISDSIAYPKNSRQHASPLNAEFVFNEEVEFQGFSQEIYSTINSAREEIYIAMYSFNDKKIAALLSEKKEQGIGVHIMIPSHKEKNHNFLEEVYGLDVEFVDSLGDDTQNEEKIGAYMHHKFIIVDPNSKKSRVVFGSTNLTDFQQKYDSNFIINIVDQNIAQYFLSEFNRLKKYGSGISKIREGKYSPFMYEGEYVNGFFELWFGPGYRKNSLKYKIIDEIKNAQTSIDIIGWRINDRNIYQELIKKSQEGVEVRVLVDDYYMWESLSVLNRSQTWGDMIISTDSFKHVLYKESDFIKKESLPETFNSFLHHHTLIVDSETLISGSNNWSHRGFYVNDESSFFTNIDNLVDSYQKEFNRMFDAFHGEYIEFTKKANEITFTTELSLDSKEVIIYNEESYPTWLGSVCEKIPFSQTITLSENCIGDRARMFIVDDANILIASSYINQK